MVHAGDSTIVDDALTLDVTIDSDAFMPNLRARIGQLAEQFAAQILTQLRNASFEEIAGYSPTERRPVGRKKSSGKRVRVRRSSDDLKRILGAIVKLVERKPGLRSEQIQHELGLAKKDVTRPITLGLASKVLSKKGVKRATAYFAR
jgi:hypothetical protein